MRALLKTFSELAIRYLEKLGDREVAPSFEAGDWNG